MNHHKITLITDAINSDGKIDSRYTCDSDNSSPELRWTHVPANTTSFALIAEDPDAPNGLFTHWLIYQIPANIHHLPAGIPAQETLPNGIRQGTNSFGKLGYSGPCPPVGDKAHRYFFRLFALSKSPEIPSRIHREALLKMIEPHLVAEAQIIGRYQRMIQKAG